MQTKVPNGGNQKMLPAIFPNVLVFKQRQINERQSHRIKAFKGIQILEHPILTSEDPGI